MRAPAKTRSTLRSQNTKGCRTSSLLRHVEPGAASAESKPDKTIDREMNIFQIGFNKCGTSTLHRYLRANGVKSVHWNEGRLAQRMFANLANGDKLLTGYECFEAFTDMEYLSRAGTYLEGYKLFPYLAEQYPDAVFILNTRDPRSLDQELVCLAWRLRRSPPVALQRHHERGAANLWRAEWDRHHHRVTDYFAGRPHRFFVCTIETDLPHLLNEKLPEYRLDSNLYELRKVGDSRPRSGSFQQIAKWVRKISRVRIRQ